MDILTQLIPELVQLGYSEYMDETSDHATLGKEIKRFKENLKKHQTDAELYKQGMHQVGLNIQNPADITKYIGKCILPLCPKNSSRDHLSKVAKTFFDDISQSVFKTKWCESSIKFLQTLKKHNINYKGLGEKNPTSFPEGVFCKFGMLNAQGINEIMIKKNHSFFVFISIDGNQKPEQIIDFISNKIKELQRNPEATLNNQKFLSTYADTCKQLMLSQSPLTLPNNLISNSSEKTSPVLDTSKPELKSGASVDKDKSELSSNEQTINNKDEISTENAFPYTTTAHGINFSI